jgi:HEAT repeat protein
MLFISDYVSSQDSLVQFGLWATVGAFLITFGLICYTLTFRLVQIVVSRNTDKFQNTWRPVLARCVIGPTREVPALKSRDQLAILFLWNHYYEVVSGEATENLIAIGKQLKLDSIARRQLFRGNKEYRLLALLTLGNLRSREDWPLINQFLHQPDTYLSMVALRACFQIHPERAVNTLLPYLISRDDYPAPQIGTLLKRINNEQICPLLSLHMMLNLSNNATNILRYMQVCGCDINRKILQTIIEKQLDDQVTSTALGMISDPSAMDLILPFIDHPRWHVRVHAATALGKLATRQQVPELLKLLRDQEWWVRYRAAQALARLPFMDRGELEKIAESLDDRYARDILHQAMAEAIR